METCPKLHRVAIVGIGSENCSFNPLSTTLEDFRPVIDKPSLEKHYAHLTDARQHSSIHDTYGKGVIYSSCVFVGPALAWILPKLNFWKKVLKIPLSFTRVTAEPFLEGQLKLRPLSLSAQMFSCEPCELATEASPNPYPNPNPNPKSLVLTPTSWRPLRQ